MQNYAPPASSHKRSHGFALVATVSMMVLMTLIAVGMLSLSTIEQRSSGGGANDADRTARSNARMALMIALGELQKAAGPDQRVTATASILGSTDNPYATGTEAEDGRRHWVGVWDTSAVRRDVNGDGIINDDDKTVDTNGDGGGDEFPPYSPKDPDKKQFIRWLVSGDTELSNDLNDVRTLSASDDVVIFEGVDAAGLADPDGEGSVKVPKVEVATAGSNTSYYAYWVEDQGVKADLAWNEIPAASASNADKARAQAARLSSASGPDHGVFGGPFATGVTYPLESGSGFVDELEKAFSPADMPLVMGDTSDQSVWLKTNRHDMAMNVRGVMANVKKGGLRRDLSLAFEMDGSAESESAELFNQQAGEFVGDQDPLVREQDQLSSPYLTPGTSLYARYPFRDMLSFGQVFSGDINWKTVVRGPSWWLLRDYANLYKRLSKSGDDYAIDARAYYPNRGQTEDLFDLHKYNMGGGPRLVPINREDWLGRDYRPVRANYAPVLLGVNTVYSLKYDTSLKMIVDPYFILWNPYDVGIKAERFAITVEGGFAGGMLFNIQDNGVWTRYGQFSSKGSRHNFGDYAKNKTGGGNANVSYLLKELELKPGEVMIYSPPNDADRSDEATCKHDELKIGLGYNSTNSGIVFDKFPNSSGESWAPVVLTGRPGQTDIRAMFNLHSYYDFGRRHMVETNLPVKDPDGEYKKAYELTQEINFGRHVAGQEFRLNAASRDKHSWAGVHMGFDARRARNWQRILLREIKNIKLPFASLTMVTHPTDHFAVSSKMEVFSQLNVTPVVRTLLENPRKAPLNMMVSARLGKGYSNVVSAAGIDFDPFGSGDNAFYGKAYSSTEGDTTFPLLAIPKRPMYSLVELSGANIGTRLLEPTHAIGNSWQPPYTPHDSIYWTGDIWCQYSTLNDVSWQVNDALFDRYYFSGIAPEFAIASGGKYVSTGSLSDTLKRFYGIDPADPTQKVDPTTAQANPALEPHVPAGKTSEDIVTELTPTITSQDGYKKVGAYSLIKGAFNVNSTSVKAWAAFLKGNKDLDLKSAQGTTDEEEGIPFPLSSTTSAETSPRDAEAGPETNEVWEEFSRLTDEQIWNDNATPNDFTDDTGLAVEIVNQVKARGPFMSLSDFVNRRMGSYTDLRSFQGAIQEAIEQAEINGTYDRDGGGYDGLRAFTTSSRPNYSTYWKFFPHASDGGPYGNYLGNRNSATGIPLEINQANILLPLAPKLSARTDTFKIRGYGEVRDSANNIIAQATCEAVVQRLPEYVDPKTDETNNEPWDDDSQTPTLNTMNQTYGRRFEIRSFRWLDQSEV